MHRLYARETLGIGLSSGTSADGVDAALVGVREKGYDLAARLLRYRCHPYSAGTRRRVFDAFNDRATTSELCLLNALLGEVFAEAAIRLAESAGVPLLEVDFIASHGQTVWHQPHATPVDAWQLTSTLQLAEPAIIAERTGRAVVANFRPRDMAAGGQGAPLVPLVDCWLFRHASRSRAVQNIGGIGNVTWIPAGRGREDVIAFDTGPGNAMIDAAVHRATGGRKTCDTDGDMARAGTVSEALLAELLAHPFFALAPPKSTGREEFGEAALDRIWGRAGREVDLVATLTEFTAAAIERSYRDWILPRGPVDEIIVGGGGAHNPALVAALARRLPEAPIRRPEKMGINGDAKEAIAFVLLGYQTLRGRPGSLPSATGAQHPVVLGQTLQASCVSRS